MIKIIPSILTKNPQEAKELLAKCEGVVGRVSIDIIDGKFADNKTIDPLVVAGMDTLLKLDFQLMVIEPINWIEKCVRAGADRVIGHVERMNDQIEFVGKLQEIGTGVGLGLDLKTPIEKIDKSIVNDLDVVLLMSVPAGFGGQEFKGQVIEKIKQLKQTREKIKSKFKIHVDGGVNIDNIGKIVDAGAGEVSAGRILFKGSLEENIKKFQKAAYRRS